jgi:hypothetical protein
MQGASIRVDEPILAIVATRCDADSLSGARVLKAPRTLDLVELHDEVENFGIDAPRNRFTVTNRSFLIPRISRFFS